MWIFVFYINSVVSLLDTIKIKKTLEIVHILILYCNKYYI